MLHIGITGGIGSGKSTVAKMFSLLGIPVYYADQEAKDLMEKEPLKLRIQELFGADIYVSGKLDRKKLAGIVFNHPEKLTALNALVHPATIAASQAWMQQQKAPYTLKEAALIFESGSHQQLDYVIGVESPETLRIQRTMHRDGISADEVRKRMARQMDETEKMSRCDFIIRNTESELIIPQVLQLDQHIRNLTPTLL